MGKHVITLFLGCVIFMFACCNEDTISPILHQAEALMEAYPDSALALLDSIPFPEKHSKEDYATWCLLITQARDKNYVEHISDSIITVAVNYFEEKNMPSRKAWSYFYLGRIQSDLGETDEALKSYLKANTYAESLTNNGLKGRIHENTGVLYWNHFIYDKAQNMYQQAYTYYKADKDTVGTLYILMKLGNIREALNKPDDAINIYTEALDIAEATNETEVKASLLKSIGNSYVTKKQDNMALCYFRQSLLYTQNQEDKHSLYYSIASVWTDLSQQDSAFHYLHEAMISDNLYIKSSGNRLLYQLYAKKGNIKRSYEANEQYLQLRDSIETLNRPTEIAKMEALYKKEKSENEKKMIVVKSKEQQFILLFILLISYMIGSLAVYKYYSGLKQQQFKLKESERLLIEKEKQLQANNHTIERQNDLLMSLQVRIDEKEKLFENGDAYLKQKQEENSEIVGQLLWKQEIIRRDLNTLQEEKQKMLSIQEETNRERCILLEEKKQLQADNTHLLSKKEELEIEIANMKCVRDVLNLEKNQLNIKRETIQKSINERSKSIERILKATEEWKKVLVRQNACLSHLQESEPFPFTEQDWVDFENNFSKVFPSFILNLKNEFPSMTAPELYICCFIKINLKTQKIAAFFAQASNTISKKKKSIYSSYFQTSIAKSIEEALLYWY